jgi:hypothetical protein
MNGVTKAPLSDCGFCDRNGAASMPKFRCLVERSCDAIRYAGPTPPLPSDQKNEQAASALGDSSARIEE